MKYYKDTEGNVYAFSDIQTPADGLIAMAPEEIEAHLNPPVKITVPEQNKEARQYLADTDWYVIRLQETGVAIPESVATKRQKARNSIV